MSAAEAVLDYVLANRGSMYAHLNKVADQLAVGMDEILTRLGVPHHVKHLGPLLALMLTKTEVPELASYRDVRRHCDFERYIELQHTMQRSGVYFHPNQFEPMFLSIAHTPADIARVLDRLETGVKKCLVR